MTGVEAIKDRDFTTKFVTTGKHEMDQLISVYNQMIDVLRTERTKQEEQHFFLEKLIQTSPTGIIILDYDNKIQQLNPKALQLLGIDEKAIVNQLVDEIDHPVMKQISGLQSGEAKTITLSGVTTFKLQKSHFIDRGFARVFIMMEELTAEILEAEKKAYGKIIRMMAHEVNNTIGPVNSILQSTLKTDQINGEQNGTLKNALQVAVDRNQNLNVFMRNFADLVRLPQPNKKSIDLHKLIRNITTLMALKAGEKEIEFEYNFSREPITLHADEQQIEQALINVVKNAIESIDQKGTITFTTTTRPSQLIISDTGKGIDPSVSEQLFTPFFSTKKDGQGVGLTLIREILLNHQYKFSLQTVAKGRTDFSISFDS
ncbi:sensor histidine kinase [Segetibacter aerophilus]|uniref:histidine kinase n=2 Tax=Segetibacter aerophilus TaxID=670293 RepID=A0A512BEJ4_9BACT|nr:sensor histidine kinase [Segetibacter aerophilus]